MSTNKLAAWLQKLGEQVPRDKSAFTLTNMRVVAEKLAVLRPSIPVITVGGTNGKGSCVAVCEAILHAQGYKTGSYFSPHLVRFNERIQINHIAATDAMILSAFHAIEAVRDNIPLSYFEFATLAAFWLFKAFAVDVMILEVGVGGRLDSVNVIDADVAVVTSIDLDHTEWLGDTRTAIALEKAGIFRPHRPAICGDINLPANLKDYIHQIGALGEYANQTYHFTETMHRWDWFGQKIAYQNLPKPSVLLSNAAAALCAVSHLNLPISLAAIRQGLAAVSLPGRWQVINQPVLQIFDVAHNPAAAKILAERLAKISVKGKYYAIVGMCQDKAILATLQPLLAHIDIWCCATLHNSRGASATHLAKILQSQNGGHDIQTFDSPLIAHQAVLTQANQDDCVLIFGSFYTVGEILARIEKS